MDQRTGVQMPDVVLPTTDGRTLVWSRDALAFKLHGGR